MWFTVQTTRGHHVAWKAVWRPKLAKMAISLFQASVSTVCPSDCSAEFYVDEHLQPSHTPKVGSCHNHLGVRGVSIEPNGGDVIGRAYPKRFAVRSPKMVAAQPS